MKKVINKNLAVTSNLKKIPFILGCDLPSDEYWQQSRSNGYSQMLLDKSIFCKVNGEYYNVEELEESTCTEFNDYIQDYLYVGEKVLIFDITFDCNLFGAIVLTNDSFVIFEFKE